MAFVTQETNADHLPGSVFFRIRECVAAIREPLDLMEIGDESERDDVVSKLFSNVGLRPEQRALFPWFPAVNVNASGWLVRLRASQT